MFGTSHTVITAVSGLHAAAAGSIPPLSAAVLERHGRGTVGLPPLPQVSTS